MANPRAVTKLASVLSPWTKYSWTFPTSCSERPVPERREHFLFQELVSPSVVVQDRHRCWQSKWPAAWVKLVMHRAPHDSCGDLWNGHKFILGPQALDVCRKKQKTVILLEHLLTACCFTSTGLEGTAMGKTTLSAHSGSCHQTLTIQRWGQQERKPGAAGAFLDHAWESGKDPQERDFGPEGM